jgi:hypothetical protein
MGREFDADLKDGLGDEERFVLRAAAELDTSLGAITPAQRERLDLARRQSLAFVAAKIEGSPDEHPALARALTDSADQIPAEVRLRLDGIRAQAMVKARAAQKAEYSERPWWRLPRGFAVPAGAFASVCVLVTTLAIYSPGDVPDVLPVALSEDGVLITSADELELYQNLEFYQWLADNGLQN